MTRRFLFVMMAMAGSFGSISAQKQSADSLLPLANLPNCVQYALRHQPQIQQSYLDEAITEREIRSRLADWYPQINLNSQALHYFQKPIGIFQGTPTKTGVSYNHNAAVALSQNVFNRDVLLASRTSRDVRLQASQNTVANKIDVVVNVSKAFYDVLLTEKQLQLTNDDIVRLQRSLKDSYNQYKGGLVDKIDYKRATIALNNSLAQKKTYEEQVKAKTAYLKALMNYPTSGQLDLQYDSMQMVQEAMIDTNQALNYDNRIEYQRLQTQRRLQQANITYNRWAYIPDLSIVGAYNFNFLNDEFSKLYAHNYPNSYAGLQLSFPIFQGTRRTQEIRIAELQAKRVDYDIIAQQNSITSEYSSALANYKSNLNDYNILKENLELARDVYATVELQYKAGIKTYLEVITAETDIRTAEVTYTNALYNLLISKLDVQRALGTVVVNQ